MKIKNLSAIYERAKIDKRNMIKWVYGSITDKELCRRLNENNIGFVIRLEELEQWCNSLGWYKNEK